MQLAFCRLSPGGVRVNLRTIVSIGLQKSNQAGLVAKIRASVVKNWDSGALIRQSTAFGWRKRGYLIWWWYSWISKPLYYTCQRNCSCLSDEPIKCYNFFLPVFVCLFVLGNFGVCFLSSYMWIIKEMGKRNYCLSSILKWLFRLQTAMMITLYLPPTCLWALRVHTGSYKGKRGTQSQESNTHFSENYVIDIVVHSTIAVQSKNLALWSTWSERLARQNQQRKGAWIVLGR